jgi:hypothetical protein
VNIHGRREEMASLRAALIRGRGAVVWVEGETGMGTTTLCRALRPDAIAQGAAWVEVTCDAFARPLTEVLAELGRGQGRPPARKTVGTEEAVTGVERLLAKGPAVLVVDECHRADDGEAHLIRQLTDLAANRPLLLLGAGRAARNPLLGSATTIRLGRLDSPDLSAIIADEAAGQLAPGVAERIHRLAAGVPLFAVELARAAAASGLRGEEVLPLPLGLVALVLSRIDALGIDRHLLRLVARRADAGFSALAAGWDGPKGAFEAELARSVEAGVLARLGDRVTFAHPLVGEVVWQAMLAAGSDGAANRHDRGAVTREAG